MEVEKRVLVGYKQARNCNATNTSGVVGRTPGKHIKQMNRIIGEEQMVRR